MVLPYLLFNVICVQAISIRVHQLSQSGHVTLAQTLTKSTTIRLHPGNANAPLQASSLQAINAYPPPRLLS